uniref:Uncharacterized protein n=1 Tax=Rhizophora mucronata TaxID=61149 RepID=A0A2P2NEF6_RHIMU
MIKLTPELAYTQLFKQTSMQVIITRMAIMYWIRLSTSEFIINVSNKSNHTVLSFPFNWPFYRELLVSRHQNLADAPNILTMLFVE